MAGEMNIFSVVFFFLLVSFGKAMAQAQVPCFFVFGDSLFDNGNNNNLRTGAKVNYQPYGIDFPQGPTGRFCNGKIMVDFLAESLGFKDYIPPYANSNNVSDQVFMQGVNYASGGSGILDETGHQMGTVISFNNQLKNHKVAISRLTKILNDPDVTTRHLNKCIYSVGIGSNDYINNYFLPQIYNTSAEFNENQYADLLVKNYAQQLRTLYNHGARKFVLFGLGAIGCAPQLSQEYAKGAPCAVNINAATNIFNKKLKSLVDDLNYEFAANAKFTYIDMLAITLSLSGSDKVTSFPCCPTSNSTLTRGLCLPQQKPCPDRSKYAFFDGFHPTETSHGLIASRVYKSQTPFDDYPIDVSQLAQLNLPCN